MAASRTGGGDANGAGPNYRVRALQRGLVLLACFGPAARELSLTELAGRSGLDKVTALRLLESLVHERFLRRDEQRGLYSVGPRVLTVAAAYQGPLALVDAAEEPLNELAQTTGQTAELGILDQGEVLLVGVAYPKRALRRNAVVGERFAFHSASLGKAILAHVDEGEIRRLIQEQGLAPVTPRTVTDARALVEELRQTRERGYALDDEETAEGMRCVGAAVLDHAGQPIAAVSIAGPSGEFAGEQLGRYVGLVRATADLIAARVDHRMATPAAAAESASGVNRAS
jgi:IclR family acetate operon transcriptional repressor